MSMATNKPSLKEKLYQETMFHEGDPEQSVFPDAVSMDTANQRIKLAIEKTEAEAKSDTAKQIFKELDKILAEDKCECEHSKCDHDDELDEDNKPDTSCIECACMKYEPYNFNGQLPALKKKYNIEE